MLLYIHSIAFHTTPSSCMHHCWACSKLWHAPLVASCRWVLTPYMYHMYCLTIIYCMHMYIVLSIVWWKIQPGHLDTTILSL